MVHLADGEATEEEVWETDPPSEEAADGFDYGSPEYNAAWMASWCVGDLGVVLNYDLAFANATPLPTPAAQADLLRDIVGDPLHPVTILPSWLTPTVVALARHAYDSRQFEGLPILADALEDAGCDDVELLGHLRGPGPHVRGCFALDLVLGKV